MNFTKTQKKWKKKLKKLGIKKVLIYLFWVIFSIGTVSQLTKTSFEGDVNFHFSKKIEKTE